MQNTFSGKVSENGVDKSAQNVPSGTAMQLILKKYHHALSLMYIFGCFALLNCPNREFISIILIYVVIFGQNMDI